MNDPRTPQTAWEELDAALTVLRGCHDLAEFIERASRLALDGCSAEAVAIGRIIEGAWVPWLQSGREDLLEACGALPADPVTLKDVSVWEHHIIRSRSVVARDFVSDVTGRRVFLAAVTDGEDALGLLHVVSGADLIPEIVQTCAGTLSSVLTLMFVRQRAEEQSHLLASLRSGLGEFPERPIELSEVSLPSSELASSSMPSVASGQWESLTERQREVLELMLLGLSNSEIAERLVLAVPTVKSHVSAVLRATGAVNRSDAVARFARTRT